MFRAAIIGTGRIGSLLERDALRSKPHTHAGFYAAHPRVTIVGGADTDPERLAEFGTDWNIASDHLYADYRELLARERLDFVSVCAYAPQRVEMARAAIEAGAKGLWLEKAVACSMTEAAALRHAADRANVAVVVNHMRRADRAWRRVAEIVAGEELGRLESVHVRFSGHFLHTGTHAWDALDEWCGPWASVQCWPDAQSDVGRSRPPAAPGHVNEETGWAAVPRGHTAERREPLTDLSGLAHIIFENGVHAFVSGSRKRYFAFESDLTFSAGRIQIGNDVRRVWRPAPSPRYEEFVELAETNETLDAPAPGSLLGELIDGVENGRDRLVSLDAATRALHLGLGIARASQTPGAHVTPADLSSHFRAESV